MPRLRNTFEDKNLIKNLLSNGKPIKATFYLGVFLSEYVKDFVVQKKEGYITSIDLVSGYCEWTDKNGVTMPIVNINVIKLNR